MDLLRTYTIAEIKNAAASQCSAIPLECLVLSGNGEELVDTATVESSGFFYKSVKLTVKSSENCANAVANGVSS